MKTFLIALALLGTTIAIAPAAEAKAWCATGVDAWCPGVFCTYDSTWRVWRCVEDVPIDCVTEPCW